MSGTDRRIAYALLLTLGTGFASLTHTLAGFSNYSGSAEWVGATLFAAAVAVAVDHVLTEQSEDEPDADQATLEDAARLEADAEQEAAA